jgi:protein-tyrosine phosphatase
MLGQGRAVPVLCQGDYGRTGTMLVCYLMSQGWEAGEAVAEARSRRPGSIAPQVQQACVIEYGERQRRGECH